MKVTLTGCRCEKCGHVWFPRASRKPHICPKCKSSNWDHPISKGKTMKKLCALAFACLMAFPSSSFACPPTPPYPHFPYPPHMLTVAGGSGPSAAAVMGTAIFATVVFPYLTFETDYTPFEDAFGKDHVFYEYPVRK